MKTLRSVALVLGLALCLTAGAQSSQTRATQIEPLPRDAPKGTNGFHALVARTGDDAFRGMYAGLLQKLVPEQQEEHGG